MTDAQPEPSSSSSRTNTTAASSSSADAGNDAQLRKRLSSRILNERPAPKGSPLRRRSSLISFESLEDASNSFHEDIIQPSSARRKRGLEHEITHWSSTPLAFAILPAIAGLIFTNGSAFVTDVLLLALAAVFMNWSIRVPREWYFSAQQVQRDVEPALDEDDEDESAIEESDATPRPSTADVDPINARARELASTQLKRQEIMALLATFVFPALAAYLLHVIRSQLSLPSTSLVSDYNISVFLLAAEFWPARQVIRLVAARTLHLQRTASGLEDPFADSLANGIGNADLLARIDALEAKLTEQASTVSSHSLQTADIAGLDVKIQKRLEPRLDSLERAVRRYEKRYTTLAMVTDQRFQSLETRMQDALSLAAAAAQQSRQGSTIVRTAVSAATEIVTLPFTLTWELLTWPYKLLDELYERIKVVLLGPQARRGYVDKRKMTRSISDVKIKDDKVVREKALRRIVR